MNYTHSNWHIIDGNSPIIPTAIHCGHNLRDELAAVCEVSPEQRFEYECPYTDHWVNAAESRIVVNMSRFEVDLNCPRNSAFYSSSDKAWGLNLWKMRPPHSAVKDSLKLYDSFYDDVEKYLAKLTSKFNRLVLLDIHSYRPKEDVSNKSTSDFEPDINVCTGTMYRRRWVNLIERFLEDLHCQSEENGNKFIVGENVAFLGGTFPQRVHETFPDTVCVLSVYVKQSLYYSADTRKPNEGVLKRISDLFKACSFGIANELSRM